MTKLRIVLIFGLLVVFTPIVWAGPLFNTLSSWEDARDIYLKEYEPLLSSLEGREKYRVLDHNHPDYIKIEDMTSNLFNSYISERVTSRVYNT